MNGNEVRMWEGLQGFPNKMLPGGYRDGEPVNGNPSMAFQDQTDLVQVDWTAISWGSSTRLNTSKIRARNPNGWPASTMTTSAEGNTVGLYVPGSDPKTN